jgi:putative membrane protein (TIGR04086 family)
MRRTATEGSRAKKILPALLGLLTALIVLGALSLILAGALFFTDLSENIIPAAAIIINAAALLGGGFTAGRLGAKHGLRRGLSVGIIYAILLLLLCFISGNPLAGIIGKALYSIAAAGVGGILGVGASDRQ